MTGWNGGYPRSSWYPSRISLRSSSSVTKFRTNTTTSSFSTQSIGVGGNIKLCSGLHSRNVFAMPPFNTPYRPRQVHYLDRLLIQEGWLRHQEKDAKPPHRRRWGGWD